MRFPTVYQAFFSWMFLQCVKDNQLNYSSKTYRGKAQAGKVLLHLGHAVGRINKKLSRFQYVCADKTHAAWKVFFSCYPKAHESISSEFTVYIFLYFTVTLGFQFQKPNRSVVPQ